MKLSIHGGSVKSGIGIISKSIKTNSVTFLAENNKVTLFGKDEIGGGEVLIPCDVRDVKDPKPFALPIDLAESVFKSGGWYQLNVGDTMDFSSGSFTGSSIRILEPLETSLSPTTKSKMVGLTSLRKLMKRVNLESFLSVDQSIMHINTFKNKSYIICGDNIHAAICEIDGTQPISFPASYSKTIDLLDADNVFASNNFFHIIGKEGKAYLPMMEVSMSFSNMASFLLNKSNHAWQGMIRADDFKKKMPPMKIIKSGDAIRLAGNNKSFTVSTSSDYGNLSDASEINGGSGKCEISLDPKSLNDIVSRLEDNVSIRLYENKAIFSTTDEERIDYFVAKMVV